MSIVFTKRPKLPSGNGGWTLAMAGTGSAGIGVSLLAAPGLAFPFLAEAFVISLLWSVGCELVGTSGWNHPGFVHALAMLSESALLVLGMHLLRSLSLLVPALAIWIGFSGLITGVVRVVVAIWARDRLPCEGQLVLGSATATAGATVAMWPIATLRQLAGFVGCWLIVTGTIELTLGMRRLAAGRRFYRPAQPQRETEVDVFLEVGVKRVVERRAVGQG